MLCRQPHASNVQCRPGQPCRVQFPPGETAHLHPGDDALCALGCHRMLYLLLGYQMPHTVALAGASQFRSREAGCKAMAAVPEVLTAGQLREASAAPGGDDVLLLLDSILCSARNPAHVCPDSHIQWQSLESWRLWLDPASSSPLQGMKTVRNILAAASMEDVSCSLLWQQPKASHQHR